MQIVAMGGGGFSMEPENPLLDDYILSLAKKRPPRVCFVPTASGDSEICTLCFFDSFSQKECIPSYLSLFKRKEGSLRDFVLGQDVVYVGGGNTLNLLAVWRAHGLDRILREALLEGVVLCGISAGSLCWFEAGVTDSYGPKPARLDGGLGFLAGQRLPALRWRTRAAANVSPAYCRGFTGGICRRQRLRLALRGRQDQTHCQLATGSQGTSRRGHQWPSARAIAK